MLIERIPLELLELILSLLHPLEIVRCREVCKYLMNIVQNSTALQLRIELASDGLILDYSPHVKSKPATVDFLQRVLARRRAFDELRPVFFRVIERENPAQYSYERCDGLWGRAGTKIGRFFHSIDYDALVPVVKGSGDLNREHALDFPIRDFIFWPAGDLHVLLQVQDNWRTRKWHFRTMSTNEVHPLAKVPCIELKRTECQAWLYCNLLLHEDHFGVVLFESRWRDHNAKGQVMIWNWVEGRMVLPLTNTLDAVLLSRDCILMLVACNAQIELAVKCLTTGQTTHHFQFLPGLGHLGGQLFHHPSYNTTNQDYGPHAQSFSRLCPSFPVALDPSVDITLLEVRPVAPHHGSELLVVLSVSQILETHRRQLQACTTSLDVDLGQLIIPVTLKWEDWGHQMTKWLPKGFQRASGTCVYGSRIVTLAPPNFFEKSFSGADTGSKPHIILLDFNKRAFIRSKTDALASPNEQRAVITDSSPWSPAGCRDILYDIKDGLRFRAIISERPNTYEDVYLDGNAFICCTDRSYDLFSLLGDETPSADVQPF